MTFGRLNQIIWGYFILITILLFSGNPVLQPYGKYGWSFLALLGIISLIKNTKVDSSDKKLYKTLKIIVITSAIVFIGQTFAFGKNSINDILLFYFKIIGGFYVARKLKFKLKYVYLNVMFFISVFSTFFWLIWLLYGRLPLTYDYGGGVSILLFYCRRYGELIRNCGAFWEPGVFACYLNFTLVLWGGGIDELWIKYRKKTIILLLALLTTQSTTGYVACAFFILLYLLISHKTKWKYFLIPLFVTITIYSYVKIDFLSEKIDKQSERAIEARGEFDSSRLGSLIFDLHYIEKHPLVGNGLSHEMRWSDHMWLWREWTMNRIERSGSGFSDFIASMGIPFTFLMFYLFFVNNKKVKKDALISIILLILLLMGEPLMLYPFVLSFPFYDIKPLLVNKKTE